MHKHKNKLPTHSRNKRITKSLPELKCPNCGAVGTIRPDEKGAVYYCRNKIMRKYDLEPILCGWSYNKNCLGNKRKPIEEKQCKVCGTKEDLRTEKRNGRIITHNICNTHHREYMREKCREKQKEYYANKLESNPDFLVDRREYYKERYSKNKKAA